MRFPWQSDEPEIDIDELTRKRASIRNLIDSPGWAYLTDRMVREANECVTRWKSGGLSPTESERLGARVDALGWVLDLPENDLADYTSQLDSVPSGTEDGGQPIMRPGEDLES